MPDARDERTLVVGVGRDDRRDDAAGLEVARQLRVRGRTGYELATCAGDLSGLVDRLAGRALLVVDAVRSGAPAGTLHRWTGSSYDRPRRGPTSFSSHALGVPELIELSRALGRGPRSVVVYGIEAGDVGHGVGLTSEVAAAVGQLVLRLEADAQASNPAPGGGSDDA